MSSGKTSKVTAGTRAIHNPAGITAGDDPPAWAFGDSLGVYWRELAYQFWNMLRMPGFALPTLLFPAMFYLFFGVIFNRGHSDSLLATFGTFGIMGPALFGFGVGVAMEREHGVLALKRVFPLPTMAYFFARFAMSMLFALIIMMVLSLIAAVLGGVALPRASWFTLAGVLTVGTVPFCALGLVVGLNVTGQAAAALVNLIYLPMAFLSGLWMPIQLFPPFLQQFAVALPAYHLGQIALTVVGRPNGDNLFIHIGYLAAFSIICLLIALRAWRRIQDR